MNETFECPSCSLDIDEDTETRDGECPGCGAPGVCEIEVAADMIWAGAAVLLEELGGQDIIGSVTPADLVKKIYQAMHGESR